MDNTMSENQNDLTRSGLLSGFMNKTFIQALTFGIVVILLGTLFVFILSVFKPELPQECQEWNKYHVMEMVLFLIGFSLRYILENVTIKQYLLEIN